MLVGSLVAGTVNVILFLAKVITTDDLILITLVLSWFAITITAADLLATTDVRKVEEDVNEDVDDVHEDVHPR